VGPASVPPVHAAPSVEEAVRRVAEVAESLPRAQEQDAWVGVRWRISGRTFAHVYPVTRDKPAGTAAMIGTLEPAVVLVFHAPLDDVATYAELGADWGEVAEVVTDSYCVRAPQKWARIVAARIDEYGAPPGSEHRPIPGTTTQE
jgi:hypothetical protein